MANKVSTLRSHAVCLLPALLLLLAAAPTYAGSAIWLLDPVDNNWSNPANWMPHTVPNSTVDVATFNVSDTTAISLVESVQLGELIYSAGASSYTITVPQGTTLSIWGGPGITNNSGVVQEFVVEKAEFTGGAIQFLNNSSPGAMVHFEIMPADHPFQSSPKVEFFNTASAGSATYDLEGALFKGPDTGHVNFHDSSTAGAATFTVHRGEADGFAAGMIFFDNSTAGAATIICQAGAFRNSTGGTVFFEDSSSAGTSTITVNGGEIPSALLGVIAFTESSNASAATLIANGGVGQGGAVRFSGSATGGTSRIITTGNGYIDISQLLPSVEGVTIGSIEGETKGAVFLGSKNLAIGSNNLSTTYSGVIQDGGLSGDTGGSLTKVGTGTLTLKGPSIYTGRTTVTLGDLVIANRKDSGTGAGAVEVNGGRIGGLGVVAGAVTIGSSSGAKAVLMPELGSSHETIFTIQSPLTFNSGGAYTYLGNSSRAVADRVVANGVTINEGARFLFQLKGQGTLAQGTVFTAINNTAATPITGNFSGLAEGSTIIAGNNTYEISYAGGDGNDMTLTVL